jgi:hypothetical protein
MTSAFAGTCASATADSLPSGLPAEARRQAASGGWTTDMFVEVIYNELTASRKKGK